MSAHRFLPRTASRGPAADHRYVRSSARHARAEARRRIVRAIDRAFLVGGILGVLYLAGHVVGYIAVQIARTLGA